MKRYKTKYNFWLNVIRKYFYEKNAMLKERMRQVFRRNIHHARNF